MAIKDWKKGDFINKEFEYIHKRKNIILNYDRGYFEIFKIKPYEKLQYKTFKTKPQALKFAKAYMRKH